MAELGSTGLAPMTEREKALLSKNKIIRVYANDLAVKRKNRELRAKNLAGLPVPLTRETRLDHDPNSVSDFAPGSTTGFTSPGGSSGTLSAIPGQVDNSQLPSFPRIGNQAGLPSCTMWATTYYQMSHQVCLILGCDNKSLSEKVFSPKWSYNFANSGIAQGTYFSDAYNIMNKHGVALFNEFPYDGYDYRSWDLNSEHWKAALQYRMQQFSSVSIVTDAEISNAKQILANGNVLAFGTFISSWIYSPIKNQPNQNHPLVGQSAVSYMSNSMSNAHAMTIVGYDDSIWIDVNGNNLAEAAELGAFKVANSWGSGWAYGGFIWASYDSFRAASAVPGFSVTARQPLSQYYGAYLVTYAPKPIKALAHVRLAHSLRNQIGINFSASSNSSLNPTAQFYPHTLNYSGGPYSFDGSGNPVEASFYFDLSDLVGTSPVENLLYHLNVFDNVAGTPLTVTSFEIIEPGTNSLLFSSGQSPATIDGGSSRLIAGNYVPDTQAPTIPATLSASLVNQKRGKRVVTNISLRWSASTDNDAVSSYIVYRNNLRYAQTTTTNYVDISTTAGTVYTYQVTAVDSSGNESARSNAISIGR